MKKALSLLGVILLILCITSISFAVQNPLNVHVIDGTAVVSSTNPLHTTNSTSCNVTATNQSGMAANGAAVTGNPVLIGGSDGTYARSIKTNSSGQQIVVWPTTSDPCQNPNIAKSSAVINAAAASTTVIVDTSASATIYVCSFNASLAGTTPTVVFKTGTQVSAGCDTTPANVTGTYAPTTGTVLHLTGPGTIMKSIAGGQICATTVGTGSSFQGVLSYVQQ